MKVYQARVWVEGWQWQDVETDDFTKVPELAEAKVKAGLEDHMKIDNMDVDIDSIRIIDEWDCEESK